MGKQDYYEDVRRVICEYIENFPGKLKGMLRGGDNVNSGYEYVKSSEMHKNTSWSTEVEILARAKCFRCDIFTNYNYR